jgi:hypothetical protein
LLRVTGRDVGAVTHREGVTLMYIGVGTIVLILLVIIAILLLRGRARV